MPYKSKVRRREAARRIYAVDPSRQAAAQIKYKYKLTLQQWQEKFVAQGECCACCLSKNAGRSWCVDHNHKCCPSAVSCGRCVRGIVCHSCNVMLGRANDEVERLERGIAYLRRYEE